MKPIEIGQIYLHSKRQNMYKIVDIIDFQCSTYPEFDGGRIVVYSPADDLSRKWCREEREFLGNVTLDGIVVPRFSLVE